MKTLPVLFLTVAAILAQDVNQPREVISGNNQLTADIYEQLSSRNRVNFHFSPFSAQSVLALVQSGARGQTAQELRQGLHLPDNRNQIEQEFRRLLPNLKSGRGYSFHVANKIYLQSYFNIKSAFRKTATNVFAAEIDSIDFSLREQATRTINQWVEQQTNNKIRDLVTPDKITSATRAIVINALYFNGNWSTPFKRVLTKKRDFYTPGRTVAQVDTMLKNEEDITFNYAENRKLGAQFLELPFQGREVSMVFVLPSAVDGISNLERNIDEVFLPQNFNREHVNMSIPKFRIESEIDVKQILENFGVRSVFSSDADLRGISDSRLFVTDVIQKTFIDVHESGVEAAAATYTGLTLLSISSAPEPKQFIADHPFIYYIKIGELIVFAGRVVVPQV